MARWLLVPTVFAALLSTSRADAYRPFDGTDAGVAALGAFELELGPVHWYERAERHTLLAPVTVLNFGVLPNTELVIELQGAVLPRPGQGRKRAALLGTDLLLKHVLRAGVLQGETGLSVALELGPLTPEVNGTNAFGASAALIVSARWEWGTVHFNERPAYSREHRLDLFNGMIVEGPHLWRVRPVSELFYERELGDAQTVSGLLGVVWSAREYFALDLGLRGARSGREDEAEVRLGFTWTTPSSESTASSGRQRD